MKKRDLVLLVGGISFIALVLSLSLLLGEKFEVKSCGCPKMVSQNFIYLFIVLAVIFVGSLLYYLFSLRIDAKEKFIDKNIKLIFSILDDEEREVLQEAVKRGGVLPQNDVSDKYGKAKASRVVKKLKAKKIVSVKKIGRRNSIVLNKELKEELI
jgi:uncharacterized membrane protein